MASCLILAHVDFGAVALELHFVHQLIEEINAAAVVGKYIFSTTRIGDGKRIEAAARIAHHDQHAAVFLAAYTALDFLGGIVLATVNNGVGEGFAQGGFDLKFLAGGAFQAARHLHDAFHHGTDGRGIGVERDLNAYHQFAAIELYRWKTAWLLHGRSPIGMALGYCYRKAQSGQARTTVRGDTRHVRGGSRGSSRVAGRTFVSLPYSLSS